MIICTFAKWEKLYWVPKTLPDCFATTDILSIPFGSALVRSGIDGAWANGQRDELMFALVDYHFEKIDTEETLLPYRKYSGIATYPTSLSQADNDLSSDDCDI